jgi:hypothetical protein
VNNEFEGEWKQAVMGRFTVPANTYVEGWGKPPKKSLRKLSLSWDLNLKYLTYKAGGLIQHLFTDACTYIDYGVRASNTYVTLTSQVHVSSMLLLLNTGNFEVHHWDGQNWFNVHTKSYENRSAGSIVTTDTKAHTARQFQKHTFFLVRKKMG